MGALSIRIFIRTDMHMPFLSTSVEVLFSVYEF